MPSIIPGHSPLRAEAEAIARAAIDAVRPEKAVQRALQNISLTGHIYLVSVGKAGWAMAEAAVKYLTEPIEQGIVLTKYGHVMGKIPGVVCYEAGHPVPDENSFRGTEAILRMTQDLQPEDTVLFLLSGGGSALFEKPLVKPEILQEITRRLLSGGGDITEINTIRKRLSGVKGGKFAIHCRPAHVEAVILSDVLGDPVDMIASGPVSADTATCADALKIAEKYELFLDGSVREKLSRETPKEINNVHTQIIGSVRALCKAAEQAAQQKGYRTIFLTDRLDCEARDAGRRIAGLLVHHRADNQKIALIAGGETVVHVQGRGLGGRNQELALAAAEILSGYSDLALISVGSDGTDGPTDAAGGFVDGKTMEKLERAGIEYAESLGDNDAYHALQAVGGLIVTGPTGTNVNDVVIGLIDP